MTMSPALAEARLRSLAKAAGSQGLGWIDPTLGAGIDNGHGYYVADDNPRALGGALVWAAKHTLDRVVIFATSTSGDLARRASLLRQSAPTIEIWHIDGATAAKVDQPSAPNLKPAPVDDRYMAVSALIVEAGARVVRDHGRLVAEVAGLEVARVVDDDDGPRLEIGVGQADRELAAIMYKGPPEETLRRVVEVVSNERVAGSHHPLARLARPRWLRSVLLDDPSLVGATELNPVPGMRANDSVDNSDPAAAVGCDQNRSPVAVVCGAGVDLDLVPEAADLRSVHCGDGALVIVVPQRDLALNSKLMDRLDNATVVPLPAPW